jgi:hypothetical protein
MKTNLLKNILIACISMSIFALGLTSCKNAPDPVAIADKTELNAVIAECEALLTEATEDDYPKTAIETFQSIVNTAKTAAANEATTQAAVDNLVVQLGEAKKVFLASAYGAIPESALLLGLSFDEGTGDQLITTGKSLIAKLATGPSEIFGSDTHKPTFVDGKVGKAMHFEKGANLSIDDYTASDFMGNQLSISVWLKPEETRGGNYIMSLNYWNTWKFQIQSQNKPFFTVKTGAGHVDADNQSDFSVPNGAWTHVVVSLDLTASKLNFYVNGKSSMEWTVDGKPNLKGTMAEYKNKLPMFIGTATTYAEAKAEWDWVWAETPEDWDYFIGSMDELKVYNVALTEGQVAKLYKDENK